MKRLFERYYKNINKSIKIGSIYILYSPYSDLIYIGQSGETIESINRRHFSLLRKNKHSCRALQELYNYVGEKNIVFKIVDRCENYKELELSYHIMNNNKYAICSHKFDGKNFFWDFHDYDTDPYFKVLKKNEKLLIKVYFKYYRSKNGDNYLCPHELLDEVLKEGMRIAEDEVQEKEFNTILSNVLEDIKVEELNVYDATSKYVYIKIIYDIYKDNLGVMKELFIESVIKDNSLYKVFLDFLVIYSVEFENSQENTMEYMGTVINEVFRNNYQFKPRYSDLAYYYLLEESCRYLFNKKYNL